MRTKAGETKRYSLRNIERRDFRSEEEVLATVCRESKKAYKELNPNAPLWKYNRRGASRRKKSSPEQNEKCSKQRHVFEEPKLKLEENITSSTNYPTPSDQKKINLISADPTNEKNDTNITNDTNDSSTFQLSKDYHYDNAILGDIMLNTALNHAIYCSSSANCQVHECSRAKEFLFHWSTSTCIRENTYCQVCKTILMDLMVCTHVKTCEVSLFKCCPFPNCDKERVRVLGEWEKLKSKHKELMDRTFSALKHVINCNDGKCQCRNLKLVINISNLILHTRNCIKSDSCRSRKFVIQLCEHHQKTCTDETCDVEFCLEGRKTQTFNHQDQFYSQGLPSQESTISSTNDMPDVLMQQQNQNGLYQQHQAVRQSVPPTWPGIYSNPWTSNPIGNSAAQNSTLFYNSKFDSIPPPAPYSNSTPFSQAYEDNNQQYNDNVGNNANNCSGQFTTLDTTAIANTSDFKSGTYIFPETGINRTKIDSFSDIDNHRADLCHSSTPIAALGGSQNSSKQGGSSSSATSPTKEMYYKLWSNKVGDTRNSLPSLSPDDLKILSRATGNGDDNRQLLSPVTDHRAAYSEISPFQPTSELPALPNSQLDDEFEEDPLYFPSCSIQAKTLNAHTAANEDLFNLQACFNPQPSKLKRRNYTESLTEWGKIDFVRQQRMEEVDIETETADESDDEPDANMEKIPITVPISEVHPLATHPPSLVKRKDDERKSPLTNFERSYLDMMSENKQTVVKV